jgi:leader peptidase (prepilin peptidase)/N-methyltransferase
VDAASLGRRVWSPLRAQWWASPLALGLALGTLVGGGFRPDAFAFAGAELVLVALAAIDLKTRQLPNMLTFPPAFVAVILRAVFDRAHLADAALAGTGALLAFAVLAVILRGGMGMGDVKLAGMLGFLLGSAVVPALVVGIAAGGVTAAGLLALRRARLDSSIAYGPFLALGGAIAILAYHPPPLV